MMTMGLSYILSTIAGHIILVDPQVISQIIEVPVLQISASPFNEVVGSFLG